jgi:hypothetical protein
MENHIFLQVKWKKIIKLSEQRKRLGKIKKNKAQHNNSINIKNPTIGLNRKFILMGSN